MRKMRTTSKFQRSFTYENYAKLLFSANKVPEVQDDSDAFFRRWLIVVFPNILRADRRDVNILRKLTTSEELSGLLNLAIKALNRLMEKGDFSDNKTTDEIRQQYRRKSSPVASFVEDKLEVSSNDLIPKDQLYTEFQNYCRENKLPVISKATFCQKIPAYIQVEEFRSGDRGRPRCFKGIRLKKTEEPQVELVTGMEPLEVARA
jgi:putative DNA primase/helicase